MKPKQVIIIRTDLQMPKGKIASQVAHASLGAILNLKNENKSNENEIVLDISNEYVKYWLDEKFTKICLKAYSEDMLINLYSKAKKVGLPASLILDEGRTIFNGIETYTCVGIGPGNPNVINEITGDLRLF